LTALRHPEIGRIWDPETCCDQFPERSLFLSASVPYRRPPARLRTAGEAEANRWFVEHAEPLRIRESIAHLCRFAFRRDLGIVFGGHPAISPLLLEAASRFSPEPSPRPRVVIFQSLFYVERIPPATLALANWHCGALLWTRPEPETAPSEEASLTAMRVAMVGSPGLVAGLFIGGMEGLYEEASLFQARHPEAPMYALGSTGSAAARLLESGVARLGRRHFLGRTLTRETLGSVEAYSVVLQRIFADLGSTIA
jgi:SLOG cluster3 family